MPQIFLHIPKTGGTTLSLIFRRRLGDRYFDDAREQRSGHAPFAKLAAEEQAAYDLIRGHFVFGYHERFKGNPGVKYLSMVRHPVQRVVSLHKHICRVETHRLHAVAKEGNLIEFIENGHDDSVDNGQVRVLSGYGGPFGTVGPEHLQRALENIDEWFPVVGVLEKFDVSLRLFSTALGWPSVPKYEVRNAAPSAQQRAPSPEEIWAINETNIYDQALFEAMKQRLSRQMKSWRADRTLSQ